jgi:hypothetical protein
MPPISEEEKLRRQRSNESVLGSSAMEGLFPDQATQAILRQYENGELSLEQFSQAMDSHARQLLTAQGKMAGAA